MNKPLPDGTRRGWSNQYGLFLTENKRSNDRGLSIQKMVDGSWVTTAHARDLESAMRHADAVGGHIQVLSASGEVLIELHEEE